MVDVLAVDFKPVKGGEPDAGDMKAAEATLRAMAFKFGVDEVAVMPPVRREQNGVEFYTIEWHPKDMEIR